MNSSSDSKVDGAHLGGQIQEDLNLTEALDCAVCLQSCVHPVQLECGHIFCFLCVKGVSLKSKRCPMCRRDFPIDYLEHPALVQGSLDLASTEEPGLSEGDSEVAQTLDTRWFYEGRNGWWEYDVRTRQELETSFKKGDPTCEMLIAGLMYTIDFQNMLQYRRNDPNRRRRIKRDQLSNITNWKGVAGLRLSTTSGTEDSATNTVTEQLSSELEALALTGPEQRTEPESNAIAENSEENQPQS